MTRSWRRVALADVGKWLSGGTPRTSEAAYWGGDIPWISAKSLTEFRVRHSERRVTELGAQSGTRVVPKDSILLVVRGMSLKSEFRMGITQREVAFGQDCKAILPVHDIKPEYLAYAIKAKTPEILALVDEAGHGTGRLQMDLLNKVDIFVPPAHEEQAAIACLLSLHDDKLDSIDRVRARISELLDSMAVVAEESVPTVSLGQIASHVRGMVNPSGFASSLVDHYSLPAFDDGERPEREPASKIMSNKLLLDGRTILVSRLNPRFDRTWWVAPDADVPALASPEFLGVTSEDTTGLARLWLAVRSRAFRTEVVSRVTGTSGSHQRIRPDDMLAIPVPDVRKLREHVARRAAHLLLVREQRGHEAAALVRSRDHLLEGLFDGTLAVPPLTEASA